MRYLLYLLAVIIFTTVASAANITVCSSGCDNTSLQQALDAADESTDSIILNESGTYSITRPSTYYLNSTTDGAIRLEASGITLDCNQSNITGNSTGYGIYSSGYANLALHHCRIDDYYMGLQLQSGSNASIYSNTFTDNHYGLIFQSYTGSEIYSNAYSSNAYSIYLYSSSTANHIHDESINSSTISALHLATANSTTASDISFVSNNISVSFDTTSNSTIQDSSISSSTNYDISSVDSSSDNAFLNTTHDSAKISVSGGKVDIRWRLQLQVTNSSGSVSSANVSVYNSTGDLLSSKLTVSGAAYFNLTEYYMRSSGKTNQTPLTINATLSGHYANTSTINLTSDTTASLYLEADDDAPAITLEYPENGSDLEFTTWTWLNITTDENATCRLNTSSSFTFASGSLMSGDGISHYYNYSGLSDNTNYTIYYKCSDLNNNINPVSVGHLFSVNLDTTSPNVSFSSPTPSDGSTVTSFPIDIRITASEVVNATLTFNSTNYTMKDSTGASNNTVLNHSFSAYPDGSYTYYALATDSAGHTNTTSSRTLTIDTEAPELTISPSNGSTVNDWADVTLSITTDEPATCNLTARRIGTSTSTSNVVITSSVTTAHSVAYNSSADSSGYDNYFSVRCADARGMTNTSTVYFKINDTTAPTISFVSPTPSDDAYVNDNNITINLSVSETLGSPKLVQLNNTNYTLLGSAPNYYYSFTLLEDSLYYYYIFANDTKGNFATVSRRDFTVDVVRPDMEILSPDDESTLSDCRAIYVNVSSDESADCVAEIFHDTTEECEDECDEEKEECRDDAEDSDDREECNDEFDECEAECIEIGLESEEDELLDEQSRTECDLCIDACEDECDTDYDDCMDDADTDDEEEDCSDDYDTCNGACDSDCETECIYYYYYDFQTCYDDGEYMVEVTCEDRAENIVDDNVTITIEDTTPPSITYLSPSGTISEASFTLSATTNEESTCRYSVQSESYDDMGGYLSGSGTAHTKSLTVAGEGSYTYYVSCRDASNNTMSSPNSTAFAVAYADSKTSSHTLSSVSGSSSLSVNNDNIPVTGMNLKVTEEASDVKVDIEALDSKPASTTTPPGEVYKYLKIEKTNLDSLESADVKFKVKKSWISANGASEDDIVLMRYASDWEELPTTKVSADSTYVTYSASTSDFSYFAIMLKKQESSGSPSDGTDAPSGTTDEETEPEMEEPASDDANEEKSNLLWYVIGGLILVLLAGGGVYVLKTKNKGLSADEAEKLIRENHDKGLSDDQVIAIFVKNGMKKEDISEILEKVKKEGSQEEKVDEERKPDSQDEYKENEDEQTTLSSFVDKAKDQGLDETQIRKMLTEQGWPDDQIEEALPQETQSTLKSFVDQAKSEGLGDDDIRKMLRDQGWDEKLIDENLGTSDLDSFIKKALESGMSDKEIAEQLAGSGWSEEDILKAIKDNLR